MRWPLFLLMMALPLPVVAVPAPATGATGPTQLYFHLLDSALPAFAIDTREPPATHALAAGDASQASSSCLPGPPGTGFQARHTYEGLLARLPVEYDAEQSPGAEAWAPLREVELDGPMVAHWFLVVQPDTPVPTVVVEARVWVGTEGRDPPPVTLAEGASSPVTLAGDATRALNPGAHGFVRHTNVNGSSVYHFALPLTDRVRTLPREPLHITVVVKVEDPVCGPGYVMPGIVAPFTAPGHRPHLEVHAAHPVTVSAFAVMTPTGLALAATAFSPWGEYDVASLGLSWSPPMERTVRQQDAEPGGPHASTWPAGIQAEWLWDHEADGAQGTHQFTITARTLQGREAVANGTVDLATGELTMCTAEGCWRQPDDGLEQATPAVALAPLAILAAAAASRLRQRLRCTPHHHDEEEPR